eukprot:7065197-Alexandrium_andersonii.AAC.2
MRRMSMRRMRSRVSVSGEGWVGRECCTRSERPKTLAPLKRGRGCSVATLPKRWPQKVKHSASANEHQRSSNTPNAA